ncbi:putative monooxygenase [Actinokineospora spheciospongiae]|uniref:Putative monooxygenase n=1 Tax=Actinokineospora spheciospongiae TaxID=909613 RepID=W7J5I9_9PSEU|nr:putative monooxygenase [Actinokineospora spheciospongiae]
MTTAHPPLRLRVFTEPQQGADYADLLAVARRAEDAGYDAFFRSDHYLPMGGADGLPGPTDAWITLAGLARETGSIRLGTLMTAITFRLPGPLAISVAQVDRMSGGRVEFGVGSGWYGDEHTAYGIPFPDLGERFERYAEQLAVITGLWRTPDGERFSFRGKHYELTDSPALPKPAQRPGPPVIIGGFGARSTPRLAAKYADEFNLPFAGIDACVEQFARVDAACAAVGRGPLERSVAQVVCVGRDEAEFVRRAAAIGREPGELRENGVAGTVGEVVDEIGRWREATAISKLYLQFLDLSDLEHLDLVAAEVAPQL